MSATAFSITYQGGAATLYVVVRSTSDWTVWNGTALVAFVNGNIATYNLAMTDEGGDYYSVAVPATLPAGDYRIFYYEQAGGSPAITDLLLATEERHWDGAALTTTSSVTLSAYALTDLASVKRYLNITVSTYDTVLTELINGVSAQIERVTGIQFKARDYRERIDGKFQRRALLRHAPVQRVNKLVYGWGVALNLTYTGTVIDATASVYDDPETAGGSTSVGGLRLISVSTAGVETATNLSFTTYPSVSTLATAVNAVSGWTATTQNNVRTADLYATAGENAQGRTVSLRYPDRTIYSYKLDAKRGAIQFDLGGIGPWDGSYGPGESFRFPLDFQGVTALYRGGFEAIPADVQTLCNDLVKEVYMNRLQNTTLAAESVGPWSVTYRDMRLTNGQTDAVRARLSSFMDGANLVGGAY